MSSVFTYIKNTIVTGTLVFLPLIVLMGMLIKVYKTLFEYGNKLTEFLGLHNIHVINFPIIITILLVLLLMLLFGILVRFSFVKVMNEQIEENILKHLPGYPKYKAEMMKKIIPNADNHAPVLVEMNGSWKPGFLVSQSEDKSTVFLPNSPDTDNGEVWVVTSSKVQMLDMSHDDLEKALLLSGEGFVYKTK
jgi:uncharacterized membrane protein